jgi:hypothetical protein
MSARSIGFSGLLVAALIAGTIYEQLKVTGQARRPADSSHVIRATD